jgi:hypothetical protein
MTVGKIVQRQAEDAEVLAAQIAAVLDGVAGQEIADALLLAMVQHIEATIPEEHRAEIAAGMAGALMANFSN